MIKDACMSILFKWNQKIHNVKWSSFGNSQRNVICYFKCKTRDEKETYIGKTIEDKKKGFKVRRNQPISDCRTEDATCKFLRRLYDCGIKNNCLEKPFFSLNIILRLNKSDRLETIAKHFHPKGYDTMKNPSRN